MKTKEEIVQESADAVTEMFVKCWKEQIAPKMQEKFRACYNLGYMTGREGIEPFKFKEAEMKGYEKGLNDAWEVTKYLILQPCQGGMFLDEFHSIFGDNCFIEDVYRKCNPKEVVLKVKTFQKEKAEAEKSCENIEVGDEVMFADEKMRSAGMGVVVFKDDDGIDVLWADGSFGERFEADELTTTGEKYPLKDIFKKLGKK